MKQNGFLFYFTLLEVMNSFTLDIETNEQIMRCLKVHVCTGCLQTQRSHRSQSLIHNDCVYMCQIEVNRLAGQM